MPRSKDLREFVESLNFDFRGIRRFPRYTADLDILVRASEQNVQHVLAALSQFGFGSLGIRTVDLLTPGMVIQMGVKANRIELRTSVSGVR